MQPWSLPRSPPGTPRRPCVRASATSAATSVDGLRPLVLEDELVGLAVEPEGKRLFDALAGLVQRAAVGVTGLDAIDVYEPRVSLAIALVDGHEVLPFSSSQPPFAEARSPGSSRCFAASRSEGPGRRARGRRSGSRLDTARSRVTRDDEPRRSRAASLAGGHPFRSTV